MGVLETIKSQSLTYEQKVNLLAAAGENTVQVLNVSDKTKYYFEKKAIDDLAEGSAPYRPRYILPDYERFLKNGSEFLQLDPPQDLDEALNALMILYRHVPSITTFPVYLGNLDELIEPYTEGVSDEDLKKKLRLFLIYLDRTVTDSFCHANLGPRDTRTGRIILELERELQQAVPNLTLKYDPDLTPDSFAEEALYTSLFCANPAICNHPLNGEVFSVDYGIASCYNILPIGGGGYTLSRVILPRVAKLAKDADDFFDNVLPDCLTAMGDYMNERIRFIAEESGFFASSFLVKEGLIDKDRFVGMFGFVGLAECANILLEGTGKRYGHDPEANDMADKVMNALDQFVAEFPALYSQLVGNRFHLHAQVGLGDDVGITPGVRIPVGQEPENLSDQLRVAARFQRLITTGCSDIIPMELTARKNPAAMLDIVKGAFGLGVRYLAFYEANSDLVRITGYLVKRSEMEKHREQQAVLQNTTRFGADTFPINRGAERKARGV